MENIVTVLNRFREFQNSPALFSSRGWIHYDQLLDQISEWEKVLVKLGITSGTVCGVYGEFSPEIAGLLFALMKAKAIIVPFTRAIEKEIPAFRVIAGVQCQITFADDGTWVFEKFDDVAQCELVNQFRLQCHPGLIVFSSGSTGTPKGILQDCERVMQKFVTPRQGWGTVLFLMMDHFGGFNTFLSSFAYGGFAVCLKDRSPESVCQAIEASRATLLPTSPTFLNLLIASNCYRRFDLSSIRLITYGTEVMPQSTLEKLRSIFPNAVLKQTYGLSELGVLRSRSESDDSVWVKIGGDGFQVKVVDNILWVKSQANMVGYLNAPQPFDEDGWMCTGDEVETRGEYMRIIGRKSEMINVGGQKVFPAEVETVLLEAGNIREATVYGVAHPLMGKIVHARISPIDEEEMSELVDRLRRFCLTKLAKFKVPVKFHIVDAGDQRSERFKKIRRFDTPESSDKN